MTNSNWKFKHFENGRINFLGRDFDYDCTEDRTKVLPYSVVVYDKEEGWFQDSVHEYLGGARDRYWDQVNENAGAVALVNTKELLDFLDGYTYHDRIHELPLETILRWGF